MTAIVNQSKVRACTIPSFKYMRPRVGSLLLLHQNLAIVFIGAAVKQKNETGSTVIAVVGKKQGFPEGLENVFCYRFY